MLRGYSLKNRITIFLLLSISAILIGAIGYAYIKINIEGGRTTAIDALYWAISTISTIGYANNGVYLRSQIGEGFTIFMITLGIFVIFAGVQIGVGPWFERKMERIMEKKKAPIPEKGHVIVAGIGELGEETVNELIRRSARVVAVDTEMWKLSPLIEKGIPVIAGDATRESVLKKANISTARALILTSDDTTNAFVSLTARHANRRMRIVSSASRKSTAELIVKSGTSVVSIPSEISGILLAGRALGEAGVSRKIDDFAAVYQIRIKSGMTGKTMKEAASGLKELSLAGIRRDGDFIPYNPNAKLKEDDILYIVGSSDSFRRFRGVSE